MAIIKLSHSFHTENRSIQTNVHQLSALLIGDVCSTEMKKIRNWWKKRTGTSSECNFDRFREFLKHRIDPDNGLLEVIILKGILSLEEVEGVKAKRSREKRNVKLLECISCNGKYNEFIAALKDAGQSDIADCLAGIQGRKVSKYTVDGLQLNLRTAKNFP